MGETVKVSLPLPGGRRTSDWAFELEDTPLETGEGHRVVRGTGRETSCGNSSESLYHILISDAPTTEGPKMLECLDHKHIRKVFTSFEHGGQYYVVYEPTSVSLLNAVKMSQMNERAVLRTFRQLLRAVQDLHAKRIAHRNLTPATVKLDDVGQDVKVDCFDGAYTFTRGEDIAEAPAVAVDAEYAAPELLDGQAHDGIKVDLYALGAILQFMLPADDELVEPALAHRLVGRLTSKDPAGRPEDVGEVLVCGDGTPIRDEWARPSASCGPHGVTSDEWLNLQDARPSIDVGDALNDSFGLVSPNSPAPQAGRAHRLETDMARETGLNTPQGFKANKFDLQPPCSPGSQYRKLRAGLQK